MEFEYEHQVYRIAFRHEPSTDWVDHAKHEVTLDRLFPTVYLPNKAKPNPAVLFCHTCGVQLSHIPKREQGQRRVWCTVYRKVVPEVRSSAVVGAPVNWVPTEWTGVARLNLKKTDPDGKPRKPDTYTREKGRCAALDNALGVDGNLVVDVTAHDPLQLATKGFRKAAWHAYHTRQRLKTRTA